jgi:cytochrome c oxidase assembly factor CtaG
MRPLTRNAAFATAVLAAPGAFAHAGHDHTAEPIGWTWDPTITGPLLLSFLVFAIGWHRLHARSNRGGPDLHRRACWFVGGWTVLILALVSPLHEGGERSFALHMTEHELLMLVAAPMLVLSRPLAIMLWAWPVPARQAIGRLSNNSLIAAGWRTLTAPVPATLVQAAALWVWHAPILFDRALASEGWHAAQHLSFIVSALLFWTAMLGRHGAAANGDSARAIAVMCLFATSIVSGALGALMAVSTSPWYRGYAQLGMAPLGFTPTEDQQVAGLIMWVPGGLVHAIAALIVMRGLLHSRQLEAMSHAI